MKAILRRYGLPALIIAALYAGNRLLFIPHTAGMLHRLLAWHFADFLAGGLMLCILNAALELSGRRPVRRGIGPRAGKTRCASSASVSVMAAASRMYRSAAIRCPSLRRNAGWSIL